jgi:hypothetical protein
MADRKTITPRMFGENAYLPENNEEHTALEKDPDYWSKLGSAALDASVLLPPVWGAGVEGANLARRGIQAVRSVAPEGENIAYGIGRTIRDLDPKDLALEGQAAVSNWARKYLPESLNPEWVRGLRGPNGRILPQEQRFNNLQKGVAGTAAGAIAAPYVAPYLPSMSSNVPANAQTAAPRYPSDSDVDGFRLTPGVENLRAPSVIQNQQRAPAPAAPAPVAPAPAAAQPSAAKLWEIYNQTGNPADFVRASNAMKTQRASGGAVDRAQRIASERAIPTHHGIINMAVGGRTDHIPMNVLANSYVLPADIVSGLGEGNTLAGSKILDQMFGTGPMGVKIPTDRASPRFPAGKFYEAPPVKSAAGGARTQDHKVVPIIAAGGEYVVHPDVVHRLGGGDADSGHDYLDNFVKYVRSHTAKTLQNLPGPKRD